MHWIRGSEQRPRMELLEMGYIEATLDPDSNVNFILAHSNVEPKLKKRGRPRVRMAYHDHRDTSFTYTYDIKDLYWRTGYYDPILHGIIIKYENKAQMPYDVTEVVWQRNFQYVMVIPDTSIFRLQTDIPFQTFQNREFWITQRNGYQVWVRNP